MRHNYPTAIRQTLLSSLLLLCLCQWSGADEQPAAIVVFSNGSEGYNGYRIPALVMAGNGDLLLFCEARSGGDASEIDLVLKRSSDHGKSWGPIEVVKDSDEFTSLYPDRSDAITIGNPAPVVDRLNREHLNRIVLPFTIENDRVFVTTSDDDGIHWSEPTEITSDVKLDGWGWYATGPVHSIQLQHEPHRGRLVVPADHRLGAGGHDRGLEGAHALLSDDHGKSWRLGAVDATYDDDLKANETAVVELSDGRLLFGTRDQNGAAPGTRGFATSTDGGESFVASQNEKYRWFAPAPSIIDPPVVQCSMLVVKATHGKDSTETILFAGPDENGPTGKGRSDLRLRYSVDSGESWTDGPLIHEGPAAYSDMVHLNDSQIGIVFEAGPTGASRYNQIRYTELAVDNIKQP